MIDDNTPAETPAVAPYEPPAGTPLTAEEIAANTPAVAPYEPSTAPTPVALASVASTPASTTIQTDLGAVETTVNADVATLTATGEALAPVAAAIEAAAASPTPVTLLAAGEEVVAPATEEELGSLLGQVEAAMGSLVKQGTQEIDAAYNALGHLRTNLFEHISRWGL